MQVLPSKLEERVEFIKFLTRIMVLMDADDVINIIVYVHVFGLHDVTYYISGFLTECTSCFHSHGYADMNVRFSSQ